MAPSPPHQTGMELRDQLGRSELRVALRLVPNANLIWAGSRACRFERRRRRKSRCRMYNSKVDATVDTTPGAVIILLQYGLYPPDLVVDVAPSRTGELTLANLHTLIPASPRHSFVRGLRVRVTLRIEGSVSLDRTKTRGRGPIDWMQSSISLAHLLAVQSRANSTIRNPQSTILSPQCSTCATSTLHQIHSRRSQTASQRRGLSEPTQTQH